MARPRKPPPSPFGNLAQLAPSLQAATRSTVRSANKLGRELNAPSPPPKGGKRKPAAGPTPIEKYATVKAVEDTAMPGEITVPKSIRPQAPYRPDLRGKEPSLDRRYNWAVDALVSPKDRKRVIDTMPAHRKAEKLAEHAAALHAAEVAAYRPPLTPTGKIDIERIQSQAAQGHDGASAFLDAHGLPKRQGELLGLPGRVASDVGGAISRVPSALWRYEQGGGLSGQLGRAAIDTERKAGTILEGLQSGRYATGAAKSTGTLAGMAAKRYVGAPLAHVLAGMQGGGASPTDVLNQGMQGWRAGAITPEEQAAGLGAPFGSDVQPIVTGSAKALAGLPLAIPGMFAHPNESANELIGMLRGFGLFGGAGAESLPNMIAAFFDPSIKAQNRDRLFGHLISQTMDQLKATYGPDVSYWQAAKNGWDQPLIHFIDGITVLAPLAKGASVFRYWKAGYTWDDAVRLSRDPSLLETPDRLDVRRGKTPTIQYKPRTLTVKQKQGTDYTVEASRAKSPLGRGAQAVYDVGSKALEALPGGRHLPISQTRRALRIQSRQLRRATRRLNAEAAALWNQIHAYVGKDEGRATKLFMNAQKPADVPEEVWLRAILTDAQDLLDQGMAASGPREPTALERRLQRQLDQQRARGDVAAANRWTGRIADVHHEMERLAASRMAIEADLRQHRAHLAELEARAGGMTTRARTAEEAQIRLDELLLEQQRQIEEMAAAKFGPIDKREVAQRNVARGKAKRANERAAKSMRKRGLGTPELRLEKTVKEERAAAIQREVENFVAANPDHPMALRWQTRADEIDRLSRGLTPEPEQLFGDTPWTPDERLLGTVEVPNAPLSPEEARALGEDVRYTRDNIRRGENTRKALKEQADDLSPYPSEPVVSARRTELEQRVNMLPRVSDQEAAGLMRVLDTRARRWGRETGNDPGEWYSDPTGLGLAEIRMIEGWADIPEGSFWQVTERQVYSPQHRKSVNRLEKAEAEHAKVKATHKDKNDPVRKASAERLRLAQEEELADRVWYGSQAYKGNVTRSPARRALAERLLADYGKRKGALPARGKTAADLEKIISLLDELTTKGEDARMWYEASARAIKRLANGDKELAAQIAQLVAIYSPQKAVIPNMGEALKAYHSWKAHEPITNGLDWQKKAAQDVLDGTGDWDGRKTNNFYMNFLEDIDLPRWRRERKLTANERKKAFRDKKIFEGQEEVGGVTADMWMARVFGYKTIGVTQGRYDVIESIVSQLAKERGWKPKQVQAAIWTAIKDISDDKSANIDFEGALARHEGVINYDPLPGESFAGAFGDTFDSWDTETKLAFLERQDALVNTFLADAGLLFRGAERGQALAEGRAVPGSRVRLVGAGESTTNRALGDYRLQPNDRRIFNFAAAAIGRATLKDEITWVRPLITQTKGHWDTAYIPLRRAASAEEMERLQAQLGDRAIVLHAGRQGVIIRRNPALSQAEYPNRLEGKRYNESFQGQVEAAVRETFPRAKGHGAFHASDGQTLRGADGYEQWLDFRRGDPGRPGQGVRLREAADQLARDSEALRAEFTSDAAGAVERTDARAGVADRARYRDVGPLAQEGWSNADEVARFGHQLNIDVEKRAQDERSRIAGMGHAFGEGDEVTTKSGRNFTILGRRDVRGEPGYRVRQLGGDNPGAVYDIPESAIGFHWPTDPHEPMPGESLSQVRRGDLNGAVSFLNTEDGQRILYLTQSADVSTLIHELFGHGVREMANAYPAEWAAVEAWIGRPLAEWSVADHERYARTVEAYFRTGRAPTPELVADFQHLKSWMRSIYGGSVRLTEVPISVRNALDHYFGSYDDNNVFRVAAMSSRADRVGTVGGAARTSAEMRGTEASILAEFTDKELADLRRRNDARAYARTKEGIEKKWAAWEKRAEEAGGVDNLLSTEQEDFYATYQRLMEITHQDAVAKIDRETGLRNRIESVEKALAEESDQGYEGALTAMRNLVAMREEVLRGVFGDTYELVFRNRVDLLADYMADKGYIPPTFQRGTAFYVPHRGLGDKTRILDRPGVPLTGNVIGQTKTLPELNKRNELLRWQHGDVNADPKVVIDAWMNAQAFNFVYHLKEHLWDIGRPLLPHEPIPGDAFLINRNGVPVPNLKRAAMPPGVTADAQKALRALEARDPQVIEQTLTDYVNDILKPSETTKDWIESLEGKDALEARAAHRVVDRAVIDALFRPLRGSTTSWVGTGWDMANTLARWSLIYTNPAYVPINFVGNTFFVLAEQGPRALSNYVSAARFLLTHKDLAIRIGAESGELPAFAGIARGRARRQWIRKLQHGEEKGLLALTYVPDRFPRATAWLYEAKKLGYRTPDQIERLLEGSSDTLVRHRELIAERSEEIMVNFDRLSDWERQVFTRALFIWPWIRGATAWPFYYAKEYPFATGVAANIGTQTEKYRQQEMGDVPLSYRDMFPLSTGGGYATAINTASISPTGTAAQTIEAARAEVLSLIENHNLEAGTRLLDYMQPILQFGVQALSGTNEQGQPQGLRDTFWEQLRNFVPRGNVIHQMLDPQSASGAYRNRTRKALLTRSGIPTPNPFGRLTPQEVDIYKLQGWAGRGKTKSFKEKVQSSYDTLVRQADRAGYRPPSRSVADAIVMAQWLEDDKQRVVDQMKRAGWHPATPAQTEPVLSDLQEAWAVWRMYQHFGLRNIRTPDTVPERGLQEYIQAFTYGSAFAPLSSYRSAVNARLRAQGLSKNG